MNILITGSNGQLGSELQALSSSFTNMNFIFTDVQDLDICDAKAVNKILKEKDISYIVNCAAYTAVDKAESEKDLAFKINAKAVEILAKAASSNNVTLIQISTDYVFNGLKDSAYKEDDQTAPNSVYGHSKLAGEEAIKTYAKNACIIRTAWLYSEFGNNFVKTMLRISSERDTLGVVHDQIGSPTYAKDLAEAILAIITSNKCKGINYYHYSNEGRCSWFEFAQEIFAFKNFSLQLNALTTTEYPTPAKRPPYSLLDKSKIKEDFGLDIPHWKDSLHQCLKKL